MKLLGQHAAKRRSSTLLGSWPGQLETCRILAWRPLLVQLCLCILADARSCAARPGHLAQLSHARPHASCGGDLDTAAPPTAKHPGTLNAIVFATQRWLTHVWWAQPALLQM